MVGMIREKIVVKNDQVLEDHTYAKTTRDNDIDMARDTEDDLAFEDPKHEKEEINTIRDNAIDMVLDVDNVFGDPEYVEELLDIINDYTIIAIFCMDGDKDFIDPEHVKKIFDKIERDTIVDMIFDMETENNQPFPQEVKQNPNSALHNSIVSDGKNPNSTPHNRIMRNCRSQPLNNTPYNRRNENGRSTNHFYNLRSGGNNNKAR